MRDNSHSEHCPIMPDIVLDSRRNTRNLAPLVEQAGVPCDHVEGFNEFFATASVWSSTVRGFDTKRKVSCEQESNFLAKRRKLYSTLPRVRIASQREAECVQPSSVFLFDATVGSNAPT